MFFDRTGIYERESKCVESFFNQWFKPAEAWFLIIDLNFISIKLSERGLVGIKTLVENLFTTH